MMTAEPGGFVETSDGTLVHFIDLDLHAEALRTDVVDPILLIHGQSRCSTRSTIRSTSAALSCWRHSPACRTR
jgi:hypothetical protein